jgi:16S rRNA (cytidine1402-2'-O)-methyltransferase
VVSTPIGNMGDLTQRAAETLRDVDLVLCEDTRHSRRLLDAIHSTRPVAALHEHNEARDSPRLVARMVAGERLALISDAGTPLVSDPGARLVRACLDASVPVIPVPGASALLAAVVVSGLVGSSFTFLGFLPRKGKLRQLMLGEISASTRPNVVYESGLRARETLSDLARVCGAERRVALCRELTKHFEEVRRGTVAEVAAYYEESPPRGEVVIVIDGREVAGLQAEDLDEARGVAARLHEEGRSTRDVARGLMEACGLSRNVAYAMARDVSETRIGGET